MKHSSQWHDSVHENVIIIVVKTYPSIDPVVAPPI